MFIVLYWGQLAIPWGDMATRLGTLGHLVMPWGDLAT